MDIEDSLWTPESRQIYAYLKDRWTAEDIAKYQLLISRYCNEMAYYRRIEKALSEADLLQDWTNNKLKTNPKKSELTRARNESALLLIRLEKLLKLAPEKNGEEIPHIEMPE